jgi:hypothetical protein
MPWNKPNPKPAPEAHPAIHFLHGRLTVEGKSRHWLGQQSGLSKSTLGDWWKARRSPDAFQIDRMLAVVGCRAEYRVGL